MMLTPLSKTRSMHTPTPTDTSSPSATVFEVASATHVHSPSASLSTSRTRSPTEPHTDAATGETATFSDTLEWAATASTDTVTLSRSITLDRTPLTRSPTRPKTRERSPSATGTTRTCSKVPINIMFVVKSPRLCLRRGQSLFSQREDSDGELFKKVSGCFSQNFSQKGAFFPFDCEIQKHHFQL